MNFFKICSSSTNIFRLNYKIYLYIKIFNIKIYDFKDYFGIFFKFLAYTEIGLKTCTECKGDGGVG